jgi:moderate conductance mechanosensitive channel
VDWTGITQYLEVVGDWLITNGVRIALILIGMMIGIKVASILSRRLLSLVSRRNDDVEFQKRAATLRSVVQYLLSTVIIAVAAMMVLGQLGVEIGPVLAAAGVVGVAVGFGAQTLVQDVISGFFILLEDQLRVGDVVEVAGKGGLVERVNLRMTILRDLSGNVHYVRNGQINIVTNMTKEFSFYVFDIGVAYREDVDEVMSVIREIDESMRADEAFGGDILAPIEILGVDQFADSSVIVKARTKTVPIQQWRIGREFNRRLKKRFDELGIEIPFPHVTLYMGADKAGNAPPLGVAVRGNVAGTASS